MLRAASSIAFIVVMLLPARALAQREVALTFDDLPGVSVLASQRCNAKGITELNRRLVRNLQAQQIPALGLVVESRLCAPQRTALPAILALWLDAGLDLGNHSFSHQDLNTTPLARYQADVIKGETLTRAALAKRGRSLKYFRHPFLHAGKDLKTKRAFEAFLEKRGYTIAPVTIDNQEWVFAEVYAQALDRGDEATANRVAKEYIAYMDDVFAFFEKRAVDVVGREIRQVLLLHVNALNVDRFDALVAMMKPRGYRFITMDRALQDPAYRLADTYAGPVGLSWIHRWGLGKGMPVVAEPREPAWVAKLMRN